MFAFRKIIFHSVISRDIYFQHHLRHHHGETISYVTSYYVRNAHGHSQAWYFL